MSCESFERNPRWRTSSFSPRQKPELPLRFVGEHPEGGMLYEIDHLSPLRAEQHEKQYESSEEQCTETSEQEWNSRVFKVALRRLKSSINLIEEPGPSPDEICKGKPVVFGSWMREPLRTSRQRTREKRTYQDTICFTMLETARKKRLWKTQSKFEKNGSKTNKGVLFERSRASASGDSSGASFYKSTGVNEKFE